MSEKNESRNDSNGMIVLRGEEQVNAGRLLALKGALKLEILGLGRRGRSVYSIVKEEFNLKGNKQKVYDQFCEILRKKGILIDDNTK